MNARRGRKVPGVVAQHQVSENAPALRMPRFRLTIEYAGTRYRGWQIQKNARSVQGELARAVREVCGRGDFELYGSGRTDAGVHALAQVAHLDLQTTRPPEPLRLALNDALPPDVHVLALERVSHRFHARHGAVARSYLYQISRRRTALAKPYVWWVKDPLDLEKMRRAAAAFPGMHDFRSFTDSDPADTSTRVLLERLELAEDGALVLLRLLGSHFLWKMVRRIVGVLAEVGRGGLPVQQVKGLLDADSDVPARLTAPPSGLFLERVFYEGEPRELPPLRAAVPVPAAPLRG
jgi:tRNA pseudouridine38-40 synthase